MQEAKYGHNYIPSAAVFASVSMFNLSGFFNVVLLLNTKPNSGLFGHLVFVSPRRPPSPTLSDSLTDHQFEANVRNVPMEKKEGPLSGGLGRLP